MVCAANAFKAAAVIVETTADVNAKFAKALDKECDATSNEVRKWFKKLAVCELPHGLNSR